MLFFSQRNYTCCILPGLAKVYPLHPNDAANYSTQNMQKPRQPIKPNFPFTSRPGDPLGRSSNLRLLWFLGEIRGNNSCAGFGLICNLFRIKMRVSTDYWREMSLIV